MKQYLLLASLSLLTFTTKALDYDKVSHNEDVTKKINLDRNGVTEVITDIKFHPKNFGEAKTYYHVIPEALEHDLVSITAVAPNTLDEAKIEKLKVIPAEIQKIIDEKNSSDVKVFRVSFQKDNTYKGSLSLQFKELYKRRKEPFPAKVGIREEQSLRFQDSKYFISIYPTKSQRTQINHNSNNVMFYTPDQTAEKKAKTIKYGPFKDIESLSYSDLMVHYKQNTPMPIFSEVKKTIEVSHWGNILVDEYYELFNEAAGIKGEFGRVDYQSWDHSRAQYAIKSLQTQLPRYVRGLYYWDYIGNISSSNAFREEDHVSFRIEPRFPVMGQWKVDWSQGYNMPTRYHLFNDQKGRFIFNYTFDHDLDSIVAENYTLKVILPEGATNIKVHLPFAVDSMEQSAYFSTLDYIGKPMITIKKNNVVSYLHKQPFQISYDFSDQAMLIEPMYVIAFVFSCYLVAIFYARIDLSFKDEKQKQKVN